MLLHECSQAATVYTNFQFDGIFVNIIGTSNQNKGTFEWVADVCCERRKKHTIVETPIKIARIFHNLHHSLLHIVQHNATR
jgi:hypothetical protein